MSSSTTPEQISEALREVKYPGFSRDIVSFGIVKGVQIAEKVGIVHLEVTTSDQASMDELRCRVDAAVSALPGLERVQVIIRQKTPAQAPVAAQAGAGANKIEGIDYIIAVASGKGGVGKSTVASNLACAFQQLGATVGLCDCDIYGPSMGVMFGANERPEVTENEQIIPLERYGLKLMSMGFLVDAESPAILRGPMVTRFTQQFLRGVQWGKLNVLVLDLPPGTGDIQLTIVQTLALSGAVIVTTPQEVALIDARKASAMFQKVNVPLLGLIENMSYFLCPSDNKRYDIFGNGGGQREAERLGTPLLAQVPIDISTREAGDAGKPIVLAEPTSPISEAFREAAQKILDKISA